MSKLAVIPSDPIKAYLDAGFDEQWLKDYYNPRGVFDEVYLLSPLEEDNPDLLGMKAIKTDGRHLRRRICQLGIDLVRAYGGYWAADMACNNKVSGVPVVVSVHDKDPAKLHDSIKKADIVLSMSNVVSRLVLSKFNDKSRAWVLPNRVNFEQMRLYSRQETIDLDRQYPFKYRLIHVGRKSQEKNLDTLIRALKFLGDDYCLLAVGKGSIEKFMELAQETGTSRRCFFIESINNRELARYYSWADCMCTPSRSEGFGIVFIEALACQAMVVTSDIAPMNEYIQHMFNGLLVGDYENPRALAQALKIACTDEKARRFMKENTRSSVLKFEKSKIDELEASYYEKILDMKKNQEFCAPMQKRIFWELNDYAKNLASGLLKNERG